MRNRLALLTLAVLVWGAAAPSLAATRYVVRFTEPTKDFEEQPLTDLKHCVIRVYDSVAVPRGLVATQIVSASSLAGGQTRSVNLEATANALERGKAVSATCVDVADHESSESNVVALDFRPVAPAAIRDLSITVETR